MHEIAAMQRIVSTILIFLQQIEIEVPHVTSVKLALGVSEHFTTDTVSQAFEMLAKGTPIEGASLSIQWLPANYQCLACLHRFESREPSEQVTCPTCGEVALGSAFPEIYSLCSIGIFSDDNTENTYRIVPKRQTSEIEIASGLSVSGERPVLGSGKGSQS